MATLSLHLTKAKAYERAGAMYLEAATRRRRVDFDVCVRRRLILWEVYIR